MVYMTLNKHIELRAITRRREFDDLRRNATRATKLCIIAKHDKTMNQENVIKYKRRSPAPAFCLITECCCNMRVESRGSSRLNVNHSCKSSLYDSKEIRNTFDRSD